jgi:protein NDRG1
LTQQEKRAVFLTVHDLGCNREFAGQKLALIFGLICITSLPDASFQDFVNSPCMTEIKERSCFIHVDVPGHADNAPPLPEK